MSARLDEAFTLLASASATDKLGARSLYVAEARARIKAERDVIGRAEILLDAAERELARRAEGTKP